jgi:hypothetical protein
MGNKLIKSALVDLESLTWSKDRVNAFFSKLPWLVGCNYIPATAINQLEMFQADTFNLERIDLELKWAASLGFNSHRVFLHYLLWENDRDGFFARLDAFLSCCEKYNMKLLLVPFDDCWNQEPTVGKQPEPIPSVHNSGWAASPGKHRVLEAQYHQKCVDYLQDLLRTFGLDTRIWGWDLYNEPGNSGMNLATLPFLIKMVKAAREINPSQPLTVGIWHWSRRSWSFGPIWKPFWEFQSKISDFISFHNYFPEKHLEQQIRALQNFQRPVVCTEYMSRPTSRFQTHLPLFKRYGVHCFNWGLVDGKTQTKFKWGTPQGAPEPLEWFHEIFHFDGTAYKNEEVEFIRQILKNE